MLIKLVLFLEDKLKTKQQINIKKKKIKIKEIKPDDVDFKWKPAFGVTDQVEESLNDNSNEP